MSARPDPYQFDAEKFGVGQPIPRKEDPVLVRGEGRYTDDLHAEAQIYIAMVRSPIAHGRIRSIDLEAALAIEGVLGAWTGADLKDAGYGRFVSKITFPNRDGSPYRQPERYPLAHDRVRYVGDPVAFVAAVSANVAKEAAEAVALDIESLPPALEMADAVAPGAARLYDDIPDNVTLDYHHGDAEATAAAFAKARHVARLTLEDSRVVINPMELRACLAQYDAGRDHWTLHVPTQGVFGYRAQLAGDILKVPPEKVTILTGHVGGSFGMRGSVFPEHVCALHAARLLGLPVKWTEERTPSFVSDTHGRAQRYDAELALDEAGRFLALRVTGFGDMGAYLTTVGMMPSTRNIVVNVCSMYRLPQLEVSMRCVLTNKTPVGAYRGAGRPEGNYIMERLIEEAARIAGVDSIELRRINQIRPQELPYKAQSGIVYDTGDFTALMEQALEAADHQGFAQRRAESGARGFLRGFGVGCFLEATAGATTEMGGVRFEEDGRVTIITGTLDYGQGHATSLAQILSQRLGVPFEAIGLLQGDSDQLIAGGGTGGSRSMIASGSAVVAASDKVIENGKKLAGWALEVSENDIQFRNGAFSIVGTDRSVGVIELAKRVREAKSLPDDAPKTLDVKLINEGPAMTFPNGCHLCEVEIDEATGATQVVKYTMVNDVGTVINPLLLAGQLHGGVVQGIGQALMERVVYDEDGQLLTGSFTDYCMPRADDTPFFEVEHRPQPTSSNPLGVKGVGEAGCAGSITSVMNAVVDALSQVGVTHIDMPATPAKVWRLLHDAKRKAA
ncbi:MAG: carbon monoxide dehydrogenase [Rhizobiales bacterium 65-9]|nr:xanthine dehydrogenase family protein molybdopterin-binding subunit [Hyphomicrobiales bacterium]OJY32469.1 MAG: carbon monoxide dehydrogenase [Rhizobiales bacterium 65-9]